MNRTAVVALSQRLRTRIIRREHMSALLELVDLLDVAVEGNGAEEILAPPPPPQTVQATSRDPHALEAEPADTAEGGAAGVLPPGWRRCIECFDDLECVVHATHVDGSNIVCTQRKRGGGGFFWENRGGSGVAGSRLEAMCCALGLSLPHQSETTGSWFIRVLNEAEAYGHHDREACMRDALRRYHAQQQAPVVRDDHDRARCDVCRANAPAAIESAPELSVLERPPVPARKRETLTAGWEEPGPDVLTVGDALGLLRPVPGDQPALPEPCRCPRANMSGHIVHQPRCAEYVQPASASQTPAQRPDVPATASAAERAYESFQHGHIDAPTCARALREAAADLEREAAAIAGGRWPGGAK